jgi:peroxiredoxin
VKLRLSPILVILAIGLFFLNAAANTPPIASFEVRPSADGSQNTLVFDASSSHDPDGTIVAYQWLYGDGYSGSGATTTHSFPNASSYTVTLLVRDNAGASELTSHTVDLAQTVIPQTPPGKNAGADIVVPLDIPVGYRIGERAPAFDLLNQAGETVSLIDFLGHVVLLEFWSSSCSACQAAMPHVEELRAAFADRGLIVITITINRMVDGEWQYLAQHGFTEFVALREVDPVARPTKEAYDVSVIPQAFLIDQRGVIVFSGHMNYVQADMIEPLL